MGSIEPYVASVGRRCRVLYRKPDHTQTSKRGFSTKRDAELFLAGIEVDKSRGAYIDPTKTRIAISDWMDVWITARADLRATSGTRAVGIINTHIRSQLGRMQIGQRTRLHAQPWAAGLPGSPETVRKIVNALSGALQLAVDDGRLPSNPAQRLKLPKKIKSAKRYLNHDQVATLALAVGARPHGREPGYDVLILLIYGRAGSRPLFFGMHTKTYLRNHVFRKGWFDSATMEVGLDGITPHELRHTATSLAVSAGAHMKSIQRMPGHASAAMTLDTYADLFDDDLDGVARSERDRLENQEFAADYEDRGVVPLSFWRCRGDRASQRHSARDLTLAPLPPSLAPRED